MLYRDIMLYTHRKILPLAGSLEFTLLARAHRNTGTKCLPSQTWPILRKQPLIYAHIKPTNVTNFFSQACIQQNIQIK